MKKLRTMLICGSALVALAASFISTTQVKASVIGNHDSSDQLVKKLGNNLIINGDFQNGLDNWQNYGFNGATVSIKTEGKEKYVELTNPNDDSGSIIEQDISSSQLKKYSISFWYKGSDNGTFLWQASGGEIYDELHLVNLTDSQETWKEYKGTIVMPQDDWVHWTKLAIAFGNGEKGDKGSVNPLRIKNIQLEEVN